MGNFRQVEKIPELTTLSEVVRFTGKNPKTIRKRIGNLRELSSSGTNKFFSTHEVLRNVFSKDIDEDKEEYNLTRERARYYKILADKTEVETERLADRLMDMDVVTTEQTRIRLAFKEKLLAMSQKIAPKLIRFKDQFDAIALIDAHVREILLELGSESRSEPSVDEA